MDPSVMKIRYEELKVEDIIKVGDSVSFSEVEKEVQKIFEWQNDFIKSQSYQDQLPEESKKSIINEFNTAIEQFEQILQLRQRDIAILAAQKAERQQNIKNLYRTIYSLFVQDYRGWLIEHEGDSFVQKLNEFSKSAEAEIGKRAEEAKVQIVSSALNSRKKVELQGEKEVTNIIGAKSTEEWHREYFRYVKYDKVNESRLKAQKKNLERIKINITKSFLLWLKYVVSWFVFRLYHIYSATFASRIFYQGNSYLNLTKRWSFWRSLSYMLLLSTAIFYSVYTLKNSPLTNEAWADYLLNKLTFIPPVTVITIGLLYSSKNYKINANLLEEYKHRFVVAKTIQNLLQLPEAEQNKSELISVGTKILFEHRISGYMDKDNELLLLEKYFSSQIDINKLK